jgi:hypothetical protein
MPHSTSDIETQPFDEILNAATDSEAFFKLARALRSDEADVVHLDELIKLFGRVRVSDDFGEQVNATITLHQSLRPTLFITFKEEGYRATVSTLSILQHFHGTKDLTKRIFYTMQRKVQDQCADAFPPQAPALMGTLKTCLVEESPWIQSERDIREKLESGIANCRITEDDRQIPYLVFSRAVDYLPDIIQGQPVNKRIVILNRSGSIPLIMWAQSLNLTVAITGLPGPDIIFGDDSQPLVFITWREHQPLGVDDGLANEGLTLGLDSDIQLLQNMDQNPEWYEDDSDLMIWSRMQINSIHREIESGS